MWQLIMHLIHCLLMGFSNIHSTLLPILCKDKYALIKLHCLSAL